MIQLARLAARLTPLSLLAALVAGCSSSRPSQAGSTSALSRLHTEHLAVKSTLDGYTSLPLRIHWLAIPSVRADEISEVDFLIDGKLAWVEHRSPYYYGDDRNWLVTSFLRRGGHIFAVRVVTIRGTTITDTTRASVSAPPSPPAPLSATWTRVVTAADVKNATSDEPPPAGRWKLRIDPMGWQLLDPTPSASWGLFDVEYRARQTLQMRPTIERPLYPNGNNGGFCQDTDPLYDWTYSVARTGQTLTLHPLGRDPCGDRIAILDGTWSRPGP